MIRADLSTTNDLVLVFSEGTITAPYSTFMGAVPDMTDPVVAQQISDGVRDWIYAEREARGWDPVIRVNKLPENEPAKATDPATEGLFWRDKGGQKVIVSRTYIINIHWSGDRFQSGFRIPR